MLWEFPSTCHVLLMPRSCLLAPLEFFFFFLMPRLFGFQTNEPSEKNSGPCHSPHWETALARVEITQIEQILGLVRLGTGYWLFPL